MEGQRILVLPTVDDTTTWSALLEMTDQGLAEGRLQTIETLFSALKEYNVDLDAVDVTLAWQIALIDFTKVVVETFLNQLAQANRLWEKEE